MKKEINVLEHASEIMKGVSNGVLITTKADDKVNAMTISWGTLGIEWGRTIFTAFVRESRFTREMLEKNGEFTVNIPAGEFDKNIIGLCGSKSGRDMDKIKELGLTLVDGEKVNVPAIKELPLTLECKVMYVQTQDSKKLAEDVQTRFYPGDESGKSDEHIVFAGEIVNAYILD